MKLTRKELEAKELSADLITEIIDAHTETTSRMNEEIKGKDAQIAALQKDLDAYKSGDWENKYKAVNAKYETLTADIAAKETKTKKETALKAYYEEKGIKDGNLKIALRGTDLSKVDLDDAGKIKDLTALDALVAGDFAPLVDNGGNGAPRVIDSGAGFSAGSKANFSDQLRAAAGLKVTTTTK